MIEMTTVFYMFSLILVGLVGGFVSYWIGRDQGEKAALMERWDRQTEHMERIQRLMAENHRLRREIESNALHLLYPENVWNNERIVPDQPQ